MVSARRLTSLAVVLGFAVSGSLLAVSPVVADTGDITYRCEIPSYDTSQDIEISLRTNAPATMGVGDSFSPTLTLTVIIPKGIINLAAFFGFTHASAAGTLGIGIDGDDTVLSAKYPKTKIPTNGKDFPVVIKIPLPKLQPQEAGAFTYTPGPLNATLTVYQGEDDSSPESIQANCAVKDPSSNPVIDTVQVVQSVEGKSQVAGVAFKVKSKPTATKRGRVVVALKAAPGATDPTGKVVVILKKGRATKKVVRTLRGGQKSILLPKLGKGRWKATVRYAGDSRYEGTAKVFRFRVAR